LAPLNDLTNDVLEVDVDARNEITLRREGIFASGGGSATPSVVQLLRTAAITQSALPYPYDSIQVGRLEACRRLWQGSWDQVCGYWGYEKE